MRIAVHDYSGHPFQVQLSRELARRGHEVLHLHCPSYRTGKGALARADDDPPTFRVEAVELSAPFAKYSPLVRLGQELEYPGLLFPHVERFAPDVLLTSNAPLLSQRGIVARSARLRLPLVFWQQDVYSMAMKQELERRLPVLGRLAGAAAVRLERRLAHRSAALVAISEDFRPILDAWALPRPKVHVVENWAPLEELPELPRDNAWAREHGLAGERVLLYSGTLGLKHDPELLVQLALRFRDEDDVRVVVISEGPGADLVARRSRELGLPNLVLLGFQPYDRLPEVLAAGDVLTVILEADAGVFSVPSKVLTYHCAARPLLAAVPGTNLAARIVRRNESGIVVEPGDREAFLAGAARLLADPALRQALGRNARAYAEAAFDIGRIGDRFERILEEASGTLLRRRPLGRRSPHQGGIRA